MHKPVLAGIIFIESLIAVISGKNSLALILPQADFGGAVVVVTRKLTAQGEPLLVFIKDKRSSVR